MSTNSYKHKGTYRSIRTDQPYKIEGVCASHEASRRIRIDATYWRSKETPQARHAREVARLRALKFGPPPSI